MTGDKEEIEDTDILDEIENETPEDEEQPQNNNDNKATAGKAEVTPKPISGILAVAEAVKREGSTLSPSAGIGDSTEPPSEEEKEGKGLFFPDANKIKERKKQRTEAEQAKASKTAPQTSDTPTAETETGKGEDASEEEASEEQSPPIQRPPPPSVASKGDASSPQSQKQPASAGFGAGREVTGYIVDSKKGSDDKAKYALVVDNLTKKDIDYIAFMCAYLADPERGYIPVAHPSYLVKFSINFLLQAIKEEIEDASR